MERKGFQRKLKMMGMAVSVMFMVLTAWLYWKEDAYIKIMTLEVTGHKGRFQAEILADGKNIEVICDDPGVKIFMDQKQVEGKHRLLIDGEYEEDFGEPVTLRIVSDSENATEKWKYQVLVGREAEEPTLTGRVNVGRKVYLWTGALMTVFWSVVFLTGGRKKRAGESRLCAERIFDGISREAGMGQACEEGMALFASFQRKRLTGSFLAMWLWLFMAFWIVHRGYHGILTGRQAGVCGGILLVMLMLAYRMGQGLNQALVNILTKECRPVTAAVAFMAMGNQGGRGSLTWYQNGAVGLYRGGYYREALELARCAEPGQGKGLPGYRAYTYTRLIYLCLKELGREEEAETEKGRLESLLKENPSLKKREDIQKNLDMDAIREWMEAGEMEQAEAGAQIMLNRCGEPYYRLPVLGVLAAVKEHLGKEGEEALLKREILTYSSENIEVRQVSTQGQLTYHSQKAELRDGAGTAVRLVFAAGAAVFFFLTAAPGLKHVPYSEGRVEKETGVALEPTLAASESQPGAKDREALPESETTMEPGDKGEREDEESREEGSEEELTVRWAFKDGQVSGFSFVCPQDWRGLYVTEYIAGDNGGVAVYQKSSHESMGDGGLFYIMVYQDHGYVNLPDYEVWGYEEGKVYVMSRPTDVAFDTSDPGIREEYHRLTEGISQIKEQFMIESPHARYDGDEFVFAVSDQVLLREEDLWNLSPEMLRIARNEIYARHGRRFKDESLKAYFEGLSWYEGVIEPEDFTEELLNETEKENIKIMQKDF